MRAITAENWLQERIRKYGHVSKLSLFGKQAVFIYGQDANKFVFNTNNGSLAYQQTQSFKMILGDRNLFEKIGADHNRVREALLLKPESLKHYVGQMEEEIKKHLEIYWQGKEHGLARDEDPDIQHNLLSSKEHGENNLWLASIKECGQSQ
ncbi:putative Cytochrome P450 [Quillaja saponaria]|uniref:Cytochrome P450 n=1 Tax=Quillaja saponaria TaxID=32244 RepID=A0AAD7PML3_QUISA|nr:putative Cytochrome P450 [Quillaja saponaria]